MNFWQQLTMLLVAIGGVLLTLWFWFSHAKELQAERKNELPASTGHASEQLWEQLQVLQASFGVLRSDVEHALTRAENERQLARSAEERTRKMIARRGLELDSDELPNMMTFNEKQQYVEQLKDPAQTDWEEEQTVPVAQTIPRFDAAKLERRRGR